MSSEFTKEEHIERYVKSLYTIEEAMEPLKVDMEQLMDFYSTVRTQMKGSK